MDEKAIAILGGTGDQGLGLALRFAKAGRPVVIGSRKAERAVEAAEKVRDTVSGATVTGYENAEATQQAPVVIISVPFEHTAGTLKAIRDVLAPPQIVVSMGVPLATAVGDGPMRMIGVWQGSCAELVAGLVPDGVQVVSAFQNVSAHRLQELEESVECDVIVSGAKEPRGGRDGALRPGAGAARGQWGPARQCADRRGHDGPHRGFERPLQGPRRPRPAYHGPPVGRRAPPSLR